MHRCDGKIASSPFAKRVDLIVSMKVRANRIHSHFEINEFRDIHQTGLSFCRLKRKYFFIRDRLCYRFVHVELFPSRVKKWSNLSYVSRDNTSNYTWIPYRWLLRIREYILIRFNFKLLYRRKGRKICEFFVQSISRDILDLGFRCFSSWLKHEGSARAPAIILKPYENHLTVDSNG